MSKQDLSKRYFEENMARLMAIKADFDAMNEANSLLLASMRKEIAKHAAIERLG